MRLFSWLLDCRASLAMTGRVQRRPLPVIASLAPAFGRPAWMKHALVFVAPGLPRFARNDGENSAQTSPRHCEFGTGLRPTRVDETRACFRGSWIAALRSQ